MNEHLVNDIVHTWFIAVILLGVFSFCVRCVKIICGLSFRRRLTPEEKKVVSDHLPSNSGFVVCDCNDCPCILKGEQCKLRGTASCFIGQTIKKEENKNADS